MPTVGPPPTIEQDGDIVTIHADIAWIEGTLPPNAQTISGTVLSGRENMLASIDGVSPIVWSLPPGDYTVKAYGYPLDRMDPLRAEQTFVLTVLIPDRLQRLSRLLLEFSQRLYQYEAVRAEIVAMSPTRQELSNVLSVVD